MTRTVVVADDHPLFLKGLARELEAYGLVVSAACSDGALAHAAVSRHVPDFAVLDVRMPGVDGIEACRRIEHTAPGCIVIMLSTFGESAVIRDALAAGARAFLPKDSSGAEIVRVMDRLKADPNLVLAPETALPRMTRREEEVFWLVLKGLTNPQIAVRLEISAETVKDHVSALLGKFDSADRYALFRRAREFGFVPPPDGGG